MYMIHRRKQNKITLDRGPLLLEGSFWISGLSGLPSCGWVWSNGEGKLEKFASSSPLECFGYHHSRLFFILVLFPEFTPVWAFQHHLVNFWTFLSSQHLLGSDANKRQYPGQTLLCHPPALWVHVIGQTSSYSGRTWMKGRKAKALKSGNGQCQGEMCTLLPRQWLLWELSHPFLVKNQSSSWRKPLVPFPRDTLAFTLNFSLKGFSWESHPWAWIGCSVCLAIVCNLGE